MKGHWHKVWTDQEQILKDYRMPGIMKEPAFVVIYKLCLLKKRSHSLERSFLFILEEIESWDIPVLIIFFGYARWPTEYQRWCKLPHLEVTRSKRTEDDEPANDRKLVSLLTSIKQVPLILFCRWEMKMKITTRTGKWKFVTEFSMQFHAVGQCAAKTRTENYGIFLLNCKTVSWLRN